MAPTRLDLDVHQRGPEGPTFLKLALPAELQAVRRAALPPQTKAERSLAYLRDHGLTALPREVKFLQRKVDAQGNVHIRLQQMAQGIPVYGADLWVHFTVDQKLIVNGRYQRQPDPTLLQPALDPEQAVDLAQQHLAQHLEIQEISPEWKQLLRYQTEPVELVVYTQRDYVRQQYLAYHVTLRPNVVQRHELFIDAHSGALLHDFDHTCSIRATGTAQDLNGVSRPLNLWNNNGTFNLTDASREMYSGNGSTFPGQGEGVIVTLDMNNTALGDNANITDVTSTNANTWAPGAVSAHFNAGEAYEYFRTVHRRNSIDGTDGDIISLINVSDENGGGLDNAFWNGAAMFYGNGNVGFRPLAGSIDVGGHEMSHGVIQETANLVYQDEPGALNESFADIFGAMLDPDDDWYMGEDVTLPSYIPTGRLRDLSDPHNGGSSLSDPGWQPKHVNEQYIGELDNGGVHINSGIPNHAYYLYATAIGRNNAEQVFYKALNEYLTRSSEFVDCRQAVIQAATDLFGANSNQVTQVGLAFDTKEIGRASCRERV